jgi:hypothetical protein
VAYIDECRRSAGEVSAFQGKAAGQVVRLSVAHHLLAWASGDAPRPGLDIGPEVVQLAIDARVGYFAAHRARVDEDAAEPDADKLTRSLARWVVRERVRVINLADLRRTVRLPGLRDVASVLTAAKGLQEAGWVSQQVFIPDARDWKTPAPLDLPLVPEVAQAVARL